MSAIFISHSSKDRQASEAMQAWLRDQGHQSIFLDFDPADGLPAGKSWEQELYQRLRRCRAVIALLTDHWLDSRWCFAEITQARALGKAIFPVRVTACDAQAVLGDVQHVDLTTDPEDGHRRLADGLKQAGLDPKEMFHWDPERPPYPGLLAFQEQDAAIFFGREEARERSLDRLHGLRRLGGPRLVLMLGASGSGKSSLVRAGMLPRLHRDLDNWLPVPPFRPQDKPLDELAVALAAAFRARGDGRDWQAIRDRLRQAADADPPDGGLVLDLARDLQMAAGKLEATVLLIVDQTEELLGYGRSGEAERFLRLLRAALEAAGNRMMALATMRSDFLGEFQTHRALQDLEYETITVDPMAARNLPEIIERPADVAGIELGPGLVATLLQDAATDDALPLLAFTLRELYERHGADGRLLLEEYQQLGGLEGSVRRAADGVLRDAKPSEVELEALRSAFVPAMVRINEDGQYARRHALRAALPEQVQALLTRFVDARLLVSDRDESGHETLEVAHEALLRAWPRLRGWLEEDQDKLRLRETIARAAAAWAPGREDDWLDHRGSRLEAVEALIGEPRFALEDPIEQAYVDACLARQRREREAAEVALRAERDRLAAEAAAARKITRRTQIGAAVATVLMLVAAGVGWIAWQNQLKAESRLVERQKAETLRLANRSKAMSEDAEAGRSVDPENDPRLAILIALEAGRGAAQLGPDEPAAVEAREALQEALLRYHEPVVVAGHTQELTAAELSPDGTLLVTASLDATAAIWDAASGKDLAWLNGHVSAIRSAHFSPDGQRVVTASDDGTARIWAAGSGRLLATLQGHGAEVRSAEFSPDGARVVTAAYDGTARIWEGADGTEVAMLTLAGTDRLSVGASFGPDGTRIVTRSDEFAQVWDAAAGKSPLGPLAHGDFVNSARFSPDGAQVVTASDDFTAQIWDARTGDRRVALKGHDLYFVDARFSPDGTRILTVSTDDSARIWDAQTGGQLVVLAEKALAAEFSPDGRRVVTASPEGVAQVWSVDDATLEAVLRPHGDEVTIAHFSPDGQRLLTAADDGRARLWWLRSGSHQEVLDIVADLDLTPLTLAERAQLFLVDDSAPGSP